MADLNKVFLMGRLTFDPELRRTPTGTAVTELRLATTRSWSGRDGERREETLFIDVTVWDRQAENCCQYLRKGSGVHVEGFLKMDTWDDKTTGEKRSKIRVTRIAFSSSTRVGATAVRRWSGRRLWLGSSAGSRSGARRGGPPRLDRLEAGGSGRASRIGQHQRQRSCPAEPCLQFVRS